MNDFIANFISIIMVIVLVWVMYFVFGLFGSWILSLFGLQVMSLVQEAGIIATILILLKII